MPLLPIDNDQPSLTLYQYFTIAGVDPGTDVSGLTMAQIRTFAGNFDPGGSLQASGQLLPVAQYPDLFALIGTTFGGDGVVTFALPNLGGRTLVGDGQGTGLNNHTVGETFGQTDFTLTTNTTPTSIGGAGQPIDNYQPSLGINYIIQTTGAAGSLTAPGLLTAFAGTVPSGAMECDGRSLLVADYPELFAAIGIIYGGDGITSFNIPDLRGRTLVGEGHGNGLIDRAEGASFGSDTITVTDANVPHGSTAAVQGIDNAQPSVAVHFMMCAFGVFPPGSALGLPQADPVIGEIVAFAGTQANVDSGAFQSFYECNGQLLSIAQNSALFAILGTTYGGDGQVTFALPDLRGRTVVGGDAQHPFGMMDGQDQHFVTAAELPSVALDDAFAINDTGTVVAGDLFADNGSGFDSGSIAVTHVNGVALVSGAQITLASGALLTLNSDGSFDYDLNGRFEYLPIAASGSDGPFAATDSFTYTISGGDTATVTITVTGIDNNDRLLATSAVNHFDGGAGNDRVSYVNATSAVTVYLRDNTGAGNAGDALNDTYSSVETYVLSSHNDTFFGLTTAGSHNIAYGLDGADYMVGGAAGTTNELYGQGGDDQFFGGGGTVSAYGGADVDTYSGNIGADSFWGQGGADVFNGAVGDDYASGGEGADQLSGENNDDTLFGGIGADVLSGGTGNDYLHAGDGADTLSGGDGNDSLFGGAGADSFRFASLETGIDTLRDFELGVDELAFAGLVAEDLTLSVANSFVRILIEPTGAVIKVLGTTDIVALQADFIFTV